MTNDNLDIVLNPSELSEAASQTAVVTFGRMPVSRGGDHALLGDRERIDENHV